MVISEVIGRIIKDRQGKGEALKAKRNELADIEQKLMLLEEKLTLAANDVNFNKMLESNPWLMKLMGNLELVRKSIEAYKNAVKELDHLISRFGRDTVNISVVGDSRAGKSRFLQTVSGLDNECIPSFPGSFCTGVSSIIENNNNIRGVEGIFTFKTEAEILTEINRKFKDITGIENRFQSLDQVGSQSPSELSNYMTGNAILGERGFVLDFIKMYVENFNIWYPYIQKDSNRNETEEGKLICTEPSEIQKYVAKHDGGTSDAHGADAIPFYRYIAVKQAEIYCNFELMDVNQIRLVDTVGLGDLADGTTEKMYEAIDSYSDAVLYFFRPQADHGGIIDTRMYDILNRKLYPRYMNEDMRWWMGVIVNHDGTNWNECIKFLDTFEDKAADMAQNVVFKEVIDVSEKNEVRVKSIMPLLESLSRHLRQVDERIETAAKNKVRDANALFSKLREGCSAVCVPVQEDIVSQKFPEVFQSFIDDIRGICDNYHKEGSKLRDEFWEESLQQVGALKEAGEGKISTVSICWPLRYATERSSMYSRAFGELQRVVRNIGSRRSTKLDEIERTFKQQLAVAFLDKFKFEKEKCPAPESDTFFLEMADQLFGERQELVVLRDAFLSVHTFKLSETKGVLKLLFNEEAEKCFNVITETIKKETVDTDLSAERSGLVKSGVPLMQAMPQKVVQREGTVHPVKENDKAEEQDNNKETDWLVRKMNQQLDLFIQSIKDSDIYKISHLIPISRQIESEIYYFLRFFDFCYHREWSDVLNRQMREGNVFVSERQTINNLSDKFEQLRQVIDQAIVSVYVPQNI